jgi:two-component system response regulator YesN
LTPKQYLAAVRVRRAEELLAGTKLTIAEVARRLGYSSAYHLSADFKKRVGHSPQVWRARIAGERRRLAR